jgi:chemotaxis protein CheX
MRAELVNPFLQAATDVLAGETQMRVDRGSLTYVATPSTTLDVTAVISLSGERLGGVVAIAMLERTARVLVSRILGQPFSDFGGLAQSGVGELANVIVGRAAMLLSAAGYESTLAPPLVIVGTGTQVPSLAVQRLVIPLHLALGTVEVQLAVRERRLGERKPRPSGETRPIP